jgi:RimJ/RimL family protein N-acetyltransferase
MSSNKLYLNVPSFEELTYRQKILADPDTMSYNKGYDVPFAGYNKETSCVEFNKSMWQDWHSYWIGNEPDRFYAYVVSKKDNTLIGDVGFRYDEKYNAHMVHIVIDAAHRGQGYSEDALQLLCEKAFCDIGIEKLADDIPVVRSSAHKTFEKVGFHKSYKGEYVLLEITKEEYFQNQLQNGE